MNAHSGLLLGLSTAFDFAVIAFDFAVMEPHAAARFHARRNMRYFNAAKGTSLYWGRTYLELPPMEKKNDGRQQSISDLLSPQPASSIGEVLDHSLRSWTQLAAYLIPVIGEAGFCTLYARAVRLAHAQIEWLTVVQPAQSTQPLFEALRRDLEAVDTQIAAQANLRLLETFTTLLSTLIGEALATRILNSAWIDESDAKNTQEKM